MYTRVTVGLDGSRLAEAALVPAAALARTHGATVRIVSVAPKQRDEASLRSYHQALHDDGVLGPDSVCEVLPAPPGRATATVLHEALAGPDELLCLATRGHTGVGNILLGSVAEGVLGRHFDPVLMVGPGFRTEEPLSFKTLLLCLDGSQQSEAMLPHAAAWAEGLKMSIRILHVAPPPPPPDAEIPPGREHDAEERQHKARQRIEAYLEKVTARLSFGSVQATWEVIESDSPAHAICQVAGSLPGAVVALATRGNGGLSLLALGSVAMKVAHDSPVPVLVVRAPEAREGIVAGNSSGGRVA